MSPVRLTLCALFSLLLAVPISRAATPALNDKAYTKHGCAIHFPKDWTTVEPADMQAFVIAKAPQPDPAASTSTTPANFTANLNISLRDVGKVDVAAVAKDLQDGHKKRYPDYKATAAPTAVKIGGREAITFGGTFTYNGLKLRNQQWFVPGAPGKGYWITFTSLASAWNTHAPAADAAVQTFKVEPAPADKNGK